MDEEKMRNIMVTIVSPACDELTDRELAALNMVAQLDGSPHGQVFDYEKVKSFFTDAEGTRMHDKTKRALASVVMSRLG